MASARTAIRPFIPIEALSDPRNRVNRAQQPSTIIGIRPAALEPAPLWKATIPACRYRRRTRHNTSLRSRSAFPMTDTELRLIAAAASMGLNSMPKTG